MLHVCMYVFAMQVSMCVYARASRALRSTSKMISKVNDVPRFERTSPWKRWLADLPGDDWPPSIILRGSRRRRIDKTGGRDWIGNNLSIEADIFIYRTLKLRAYSERLRAFNNRFPWYSVDIMKGLEALIRFIDYVMLEYFFTSILFPMI